MNVEADVWLNRTSLEDTIEGIFILIVLMCIVLFFFNKTDDKK